MFAPLPGENEIFWVVVSNTIKLMVSWLLEVKSGLGKSMAQGPTTGKRGKEENHFRSQFPCMQRRRKVTVLVLTLVSGRYLLRVTEKKQEHFA